MADLGAATLGGLGQGSGLDLEGTGDIVGEAGVEAVRSGGKVSVRLDPRPGRAVDGIPTAGITAPDLEAAL